MDKAPENEVQENQPAVTEGEVIAAAIPKSEINLSGFAKFMSEYGIWIWAFGYFAAYVPYSALTKLLTSGQMPGMPKELIIGSSEMLPLSAIAAVIGAFIFLTIMKWWKYANHIKIGGLSIPTPTKWTFLSGCCSTFIIATTTLAYTFDGVSIVFVMLLMRGGLLVLGPVIDIMRKRQVRWFSWVAFVLSVLALLIPFLIEQKGEPIFKRPETAAICLINVGVYLLAYFIRLNFMSSQAKSADENANIKYFVEEQLTSSPMLVLVLSIIAFFPPAGTPDTLTSMQQLLMGIHNGFTSVFANPFWIWIFVVGIFSAGTGAFGGLVLLDKGENTFCIPVNRSSSIIAGVLASLIVGYFGGKLPRTTDFVAAGIIILAILVLTLPLFLGKKKT